MDGLSDDDLLAACLDRDHPLHDAAWTELFEIITLHVARCTSRFGGVAIIGEMTQECQAEVLLRLVDDDFSLLRQWRRRASLKTYLQVVSRNLTIDVLRRLRRANKTVCIADPMEDVDAPGPDSIFSQGYELETRVLLEQFEAKVRTNNDSGDRDWGIAMASFVGRMTAREISEKPFAGGLGPRGVQAVIFRIRDLARQLFGPTAVD